MDTTTVQTIHDAIKRNANVTVAMKSGLTKTGRPLHFIHDKFLIIQNTQRKLKHDLILIEDIRGVSLG